MSEENYFISEETDTEQMKILLEAMDKFKERNAKYKDVWKEGGWTDSAHHIRHKSTRITILLNGVSQLSDAELFVEDAIDLINYCAFFVRNVRAARARTPRHADGVKAVPRG